MTTPLRGGLTSPGSRNPCSTCHGLTLLEMSGDGGTWGSVICAQLNGPSIEAYHLAYSASKGMRKLRGGARGDVEVLEEPLQLALGRKVDLNATFAAPAHNPNRRAEGDA